MVKRSLRLTVPEHMYAEIERLAKVTDASLARTALLVLAFGLATVDAITDPELPPQEKR